MGNKTISERDRKTDGMFFRLVLNGNQCLRTEINELRLQNTPSRTSITFFQVTEI